jgi:hypothetical protein
VFKKVASGFKSLTVSDHPTARAINVRNQVMGTSSILQPAWEERPGDNPKVIVLTHSGEVCSMNAAQWHLKLACAYGPALPRGFGSV